MSEKLLDGIHCAEDVKKLNIDQLTVLACEVRQLILATAQENGGHLASSLGAVDAIIALYYVYDFPKDKLIFDVGHQAYCSKILSGRKDSFSTIRKEGGLSGFPCRDENECD